MGKKWRTQRKFAFVVGLIQIAVIALFAAFVDYSQVDETSPTADDGATLFVQFQIIHSLVFFSISFLYAFMKNYGYSGITLSMLLAAISFEIGILTQNVYSIQKGKIRIGMKNLIEGEFAAVSSLIALGGIFGKVNRLQMAIFVILETICYSFNNYWCLTILQVKDLGGSVALHLFAAIFGLSAAFILDKGKQVKGNVNDATSYTSNIFCLLGTLYIWAYWPTFNSILASKDATHRSAINTTLALMGSCITALLASSFMNREGKFEMTHVQNATLAGGVAIGTSTDLMIGPAGALAIGSVGGILSVLGFSYSSSFLWKRMKIYDTCGINNLHAIPGIASGVIAAFLTLIASEQTYGPVTLYEFYPAMAPLAGSEKLLKIQSIHPEIIAGAGRTTFEQCAYQLLYVVASITTAIISGIIAGLILRSSLFEPLKEEEMYLDDLFFKLPKQEIVQQNHNHQLTETNHNTTVL